MNLARRYLGMVKFEHTLFALPFALLTLLVAARGWPEGRVLIWVLVAMVGARSAAMAFNRLVDRHYDRQNPRTRDRHLPAGRVSVGGAWVFTIISSLIFVFAASQLNPLCFVLSPVALAIVFFYSFTKRFTVASHLFLGLGLGVAPVGAWIAVTGRIDAFPLWVAAGVLFWVAGFDTIYSCQDADFDRRVGLHSLAARCGVRNALWFSRLFHLLALVSFAVAFTRSAVLGPVSLLGLALMAVLLGWEQWLVRGGDLRRIDQAFFTINSWIGIVILGWVACDLYML
jgi:4-hydroxybenzoate polyprenyltransferase